MKSPDDDLEALRAEIARLREEAKAREVRAEEELRASRATHEALIEETRLSLEALRQSEEKLRLATHAADIGLWSWDHAADRVEWSDVLCRIWGITPDDVPRDRTAYLSYVHPEDRERARDRIARGVVERWWADEYRIVRGDGTTRWVASYAKVLRVQDRDVAFGAVFDVTERRERDERLRQAQKLEAVGQLTAGIAHNFNNMLMGILPNLELAERRASPEVVPLLRSATHAAHRAAELVRQLVTFAGRNRHQARTLEPLAALVERSVALCRTTFDQGIAITTRLTPEAYVRVDAAQVQQGVLNVLINARDAVGDPEVRGPRVAVEVSVIGAGAPELGGRAGDFARVRVQDNGVGMDAATMQHLYEPFFTTKALGKGTGLGLATTHAIVAEHGGFVTCTSAPHEGTEVSLYFANEKPPEEATAPVSRVPSARGTETVLIVDDEPAVRRAVAALLEDAGFRAIEAGSGEDALARLADPAVVARVQVVLLDVSMPGMPSHVVRAQLREIIPDARVVYFTGYAYDAADAADAVLQKPVTRDELLTVLRDVIDRPREVHSVG
jgi:PAS domain S-box-containing protein